MNGTRRKETRRKYERTKVVNENYGPRNRYKGTSVCLFGSLHFHTHNHSKQTQTNYRITTAKHAFSLPLPTRNTPHNFFILDFLSAIFALQHTRSHWFGRLAQENDAKTCWYERLDSLLEGVKKKKKKIAAYNGSSTTTSSPFVSPLIDTAPPNSWCLFFCGTFILSFHPTTRPETKKEGSDEPRTDNVHK